MVLLGRFALVEIQVWIRHYELNWNVNIERGGGPVLGQVGISCSLPLSHYGLWEVPIHTRDIVKGAVDVIGRVNSAF